jgi:hypothetical protein
VQLLEMSNRLFALTTEVHALTGRILEAVNRQGRDGRTAGPTP